MGFSLRRAAPADAPALTRCIEAAYAGYGALAVDLPDVSGGVAEEIRDNIVWLAVGRGEILGGVILSLAGDTAHLINVAVHPDHAGKGVGRALMETAADVARAAGRTRMRLATHRAMSRNVALYRHLGWQVTGEEGDRVTMERRLKD